MESPPDPPPPPIGSPPPCGWGPMGAQQLTSPSPTESPHRMQSPHRDQTSKHSVGPLLGCDSAAPDTSPYVPRLTSRVSSSTTPTHLSLSGRPDAPDVAALAPGRGPTRLSGAHRARHEALPRSRFWAVRAASPRTPTPPPAAEGDVDTAARRSRGYHWSRPRATQSPWFFPGTRPPTTTRPLKGDRALPPLRPGCSARPPWGTCGCCGCCCGMPPPPPAPLPMRGRLFALGSPRTWSGRAARNLLRLATPGPTTKSGPDSEHGFSASAAKYHPVNPASTAPDAQNRSNLTRSGPYLTRGPPMRVRVRPGPARTRPTLNRFRPIWPILTPIWPILTRARPNLTRSRTSHVFSTPCFY